jgi:hypothetical protein
MSTTDLSASTAPHDQPRQVVAVAWPTGRPLYAYTLQEIAAGVDLYTRRLKTGHSRKAGDRHAA